MLVRTIVGGGGTLLQEIPVIQLHPRARHVSAAAPSSDCCQSRRRFDSRQNPQSQSSLVSVEQKKKPRQVTDGAFFVTEATAPDYLIFDSL
jgi:hypothetical protein